MGAAVFEDFGVAPVVNCCGIYTDLGGSILEPSVWRAASELNGAFVRMTDLMDAAGRRIAGHARAEAARVTPSCSAALALAVGATMTGRRGESWEQLPDTRGLKSRVVISAHHLANYKYANCARMPGGILVPAGSVDHYDLQAVVAEIDADTACVLVPAHLLDGFDGVARLAELIEASHARGAPVVVDAAYMCDPPELLASFAGAGADLTCFSAKYFGGPNSGGFVSGKADLIAAVEGLDFTRFESGLYRSFGRAFKMSRYDVAGIALALDAWMARDHDARWAGYADRVAAMARSAGPMPDGVKAEPMLFTMSEELIPGRQVNALVLTFAPSTTLTPGVVAERLAADSPSIASIPEGELLILAVDALTDDQPEWVGARLSRALGA
jgi:L-seryl-tRNA(Ser) seleniumtransferase